MIRPILRWVARRHQRRLGVETPYLDEVIEHAPGAVVPILGFIPAAGYGSHLPPDTLHVVRLGATLAQDCGTCLSIEVNRALAAGVPREVIAAAVGGSRKTLEPELEAARRFGERVARGLDVEEERTSLRDRFGARGVIEASIAVAGALTFPAVQRGMGHARACELEGIHRASSSP